MANTVIEPIDLGTFISQINGIVQAPVPEANGAVTTCPRTEPDRWDEMIKRLIGLRNLQEDWDGMGAKAPKAALIDSALDLAVQLRQQGFRHPSRVGAGPDGEILLEWQDDHLYLEAEISAPHSTEWMLAIDDQRPKHWVTR
jgi:hypothetical protein